MSPANYSENSLIEQPAIALFGELGWETALCFREFDQPGGSPLRDEVAASGVNIAARRRET